MAPAQLSSSATFLVEWDPYQNVIEPVEWARLRLAVGLGKRLELDAAFEPYLYEGLFSSRERVQARFGITQWGQLPVNPVAVLGVEARHTLGPVPFGGLFLWALAGGGLSGELATTVVGHIRWAANATFQHEVAGGESGTDGFHYYQEDSINAFRLSAAAAFATDRFSIGPGFWWEQGGPLPPSLADCGPQHYWNRWALGAEFHLSGVIPHAQLGLLAEWGSYAYVSDSCLEDGGGSEVHIALDINYEGDVQAH